MFLYITTATTALLFVSDFQEMFSSAVRLSLHSHPLFPWDGWLLLITTTISPVCQGAAAGSGCRFTCSQRTVGPLLSLALTTLHSLLTALGWSGAALNTTKFITHRRVPAPTGEFPHSPEAPGSLQAEPPVSQTDHLGNVGSLVRNYKRVDGAFRGKRGSCFFSPRSQDSEARGA